MDQRQQFQATDAAHVYVADDELKFALFQHSKGFFG